MNNVHTIIAMTRSGLIGSSDRLPWHLPDDLKRFAKMTHGNTLLMGAKTFLGAIQYFKRDGEVFPGRKIAVVGNDRHDQSLWHQLLEEVRLKNRKIDPENLAVVYPHQTPETELEYVQDFAGKDAKIFIAGGAFVYSRYLDCSDEINLTWINGVNEEEILHPVYLNEDTRRTIKKYTHDDTVNVSLEQRCYGDNGLVGIFLDIKVPKPIIRFMF